MAKSDTWMPLYVGDYLADTMLLTTEQHGAYLLLLMACWKLGGAIPADDDQLCQIARCTPQTWKRIKPAVIGYFDVDGGTWSQNRVTRELGRASDKASKAEAKAKNAAGVRWSKQSTSNASSNAQSKQEALLEECPPPPPLHHPSDDIAPDESGTGPTWAAYTDAYQKRWGIKPLRDAKSNTLMKVFVKRIGPSEAPEVAAYFVRCSGDRGQYVLKRHAVGVLLNDTEAIYADWRRGHDGEQLARPSNGAASMRAGAGAAMFDALGVPANLEIGGPQ